MATVDCYWLATFLASDWLRGIGIISISFSWISIGSLLQFGKSCARMPGHDIIDVNF